MDGYIPSVQKPVWRKFAPLIGTAFWMFTDLAKLQSPSLLTGFCLVLLLSSCVSIAQSAKQVQ